MCPHLVFYCSRLLPVLRNPTVVTDTGRTLEFCAYNSNLNQTLCNELNFIPAGPTVSWINHRIILGGGVSLYWPLIIEGRSFTILTFIYWGEEFHYADLYPLPYIVMAVSIVWSIDLWSREVTPPHPWSILRCHH